MNNKYDDEPLCYSIKSNPTGKNDIVIFITKTSNRTIERLNDKLGMYSDGFNKNIFTIYKPIENKNNKTPKKYSNTKMYRTASCLKYTSVYNSKIVQEFSSGKLLFKLTDVVAYFNTTTDDGDYGSKTTLSINKYETRPFSIELDYIIYLLGKAIALFDSTNDFSVDKNDAYTKNSIFNPHSEWFNFNYIMPKTEFTSDINKYITNESKKFIPTCTMLYDVDSETGQRRLLSNIDPNNPIIDHESLKGIMPNGYARWDVCLSVDHVYTHNKKINAKINIRELTHLGAIEEYDSPPLDKFW